MVELLTELLKGLPKAVLYMLFGAVGGIYGAGYYTASAAQKSGMEAEFSDYGFLKKVAVPEAAEVKTCREMRVAYDAGRQALVEQMKTLGDRKASSNQALANVLKEYPAARQNDEKNDQTGYSGSGSSILRSDIYELRNDIAAADAVERELRANLANEYNNLARFCYQTVISRR